MSDSDEVVDGMQLAFEEAKKLHKVNPKHELLRFFTEGNKKAVYEEFQQRFGKQGITKKQRSSYPAQAYFHAQYFLALKKALEKESGQKDEHKEEDLHSQTCLKEDVSQNMEDPF